jgi:hypothetical protein
MTGAFVRVVANAEFAQDFWQAQDRRFDPQTVADWMVESNLEDLHRDRQSIAFLVEGTKPLHP